MPWVMPRCRFLRDYTRNSISYNEMVAPRDGFEPSTNRLTAGCSTAELPGNSLLAQCGSLIATVFTFAKHQFRIFQEFLAAGLAFRRAASHMCRWAGRVLRPDGAQA